MVARTRRVGEVESGGLDGLETGEDPGHLVLGAAQGTHNEEILFRFGQDDPLAATGADQRSYGVRHAAELLFDLVEIALRHQAALAGREDPLPAFEVRHLHPAHLGYSFRPVRWWEFNGGDGEVNQPRTGRVMPPKALGGPILDPTGHPLASKSAEFTSSDRRERLAIWLTSAENPFFARCMANRIWFHVMGRGVVEPVDDFRDSNPPSNDELLQALADTLVQSRFNLRTLVRSILTSRTYQLSSRTHERNADDSIYFSHALTKLLPAEVLLDAISSVTGKASAFGGLPGGTRATQIPDSAMEDPFLKTFGRPARELACECERESDSNLSQALQLIGGATVNDKLHADDGRMALLAKSDKPPETIARELYSIALSRDPSTAELSSAVKHLSTSPDRRQAVEDLGWVLINSKEFLFRH